MLKNAGAVVSQARGIVADDTMAARVLQTAMVHAINGNISTCTQIDSYHTSSLQGHVCLTAVPS